jgi:hypothetical protein
VSQRGYVDLGARHQRRSTNRSTETFCNQL